MNTQLIVDWSTHAAALHQVLALASSQLRIFDDDLSRLGLEERESAERLARHLSSDRRNSLRIVVRDSTYLRLNCPRLMRLLATYPQQVHASQCSPQVAPAIEALCLADDRHALVRFAKDHPRARLVIDNASECAPYREQFETLLAASGEQISATTLGL